MSRVAILGIPIDSVTQMGAIRQIQKMLAADIQHHVMTPNSEMLVEATHHQEFFSVLQRTSLNIPDSAGLVWAARRTHQVLPERVAGVDVVTELCASLNNTIPVFLLGGRDNVVQSAGDVLQKHNSQLDIVGTYEGSPRDEDAEDILRVINTAQPKLLLVAYGAPAQDLWIAKHLSQMPSVRVAMGVGGTFDFIAGKVRRAPVWMQRLGLEWLWRLLREPWRIRRIGNAVIVFPWLVLRYGRDSSS